MRALVWEQPAKMTVDLRTLRTLVTSLTPQLGRYSLADKLTELAINDEASAAILVTGRRDPTREGGVDEAHFDRSIHWPCCYR